MLVSVNILTWNAQKYIRQCLNGVFSQSYDKFEINIVDNGSKDNTVVILKEEFLPKYKGIKLIENKNNIGFAQGHNQLIKISSGDLILSLNQDLILEKDYIKNSVSLFKDKSIGAMQGKLYRFDWDKNEIQQNEGKKIIDTTGLIILKSRRVINRGQGQPDLGLYENIEEIFGVDGAAPIYRRQALEDIKLPFIFQSFNDEYFDSDFFSYLEDVDISWRLRLAGWKIVYNPKAIGYHGRGAKDVKNIFNFFELFLTRKNINSFVKKISWRNRRLMQLKNEFVLNILKDAPFWLIKEFLGLIYILFFEPQTLKAIPEFFSMAPKALKKRKYIMNNLKVKPQDIRQWFQ